MAQRSTGLQKISRCSSRSCGAAYAQCCKWRNAHYQQMAKPDRDRANPGRRKRNTNFLSQYPKDPLAPRAEQRLRDVQEVIAEGDYRMGTFTMLRETSEPLRHACFAIRKADPLYSRSDRGCGCWGISSRRTSTGKSLRPITEHREELSAFEFGAPNARTN